MPHIRCPTIIGREEASSRLAEAVEASRQGHGRVTVLTGPAGIGKSRLAAGAVDQARAVGASVIAGRALPAEVPEPYRPLAEALLAAARAGWSPSSPSLRGLRSALGRLVPEWRQSGSVPHDESPVLIAEALLRALGSLAFETASVLVIEDLQWADPESLGVLEYLADHCSGLPVLCLATLRDDSETLATELLRRLEGRSAVEVIRLRPLTSDQVTRMALDCLGTNSLPVGLEAWLREGAEGIPFFVEELLAAAASAGVLVPADHGWSLSGSLRQLVPESFAESVRRRLSEIGEQGRRLLGIAALLGRYFDWQLAAEASGCPPVTAHAVLEQAVEQQLVIARDGRFSFPHALTREAVLGLVLPTERMRFAADAARVLERSALGEAEWRHRAADLAELAGDTHRAALLLFEAGRASLRRGALATAASALERAARLSADRRLLADVEEARAETRAAAGDLAGTREAVSSLLDILEAIGSPPGRRGQGHLLVARSAVAATEFDLASEELAHARRLGGLAEDGALAARVGAVAAHLAIGEGRLGEAEAVAFRAAAEASATGQPEVVCEALEVAGRCARTRDLDEAAEIGERALGVAEAHGLALWRMRANYQVGIVELFRSGAVGRLQRARDEAQRLGALATAVNLDLEIGAGLGLQCRREESLESLGRCIEMAALFGLRTVEAMAHVFVAINHAEIGARRPMEEAIARAMSLAPEDPEVVGSMWGDARAVASLADENRPRAREELGRAMTAYGSRSAAVPHLAVALGNLIACLDGEAPEPLAAEGVTGVVFQSAGYLAYADAMVHGRAGRRGEAGTAAELGDRHLAAAPWYLHLVRRLSAEAAIADGWGKPGSWLAEAAGFFETSGNERLASACRSLLRRTGARVTRPTLAARELPRRLREAGVTAREAEVLDLVGGGLSNREIAARLFLSDRTVEQHVGWLKRKLRLRSRPEMVAFAAGLAGITEAASR